MSLRYALLGLLAERPMSGYDISKAFDQSLAYVWSAQHSQIYPELARLLEEELIHLVERGPRGRKAYALTDRGLDRLKDWLATTSPDRTVRDDAFLRVFFLWLMEPRRAREFLRGEAAYHRDKLAVYERYAASATCETPADLASRISLEAGIRHERTLMQWAEWAERRLGAGQGKQRKPR